MAGYDRRRELGKRGEEIAAVYLEKNGYRVIERNYRNKLGEIDIIAQNGAVLCFIEVKTRRSTSFGFPEEAIKKTKQRKIGQIVLAYLKIHNRLKEQFRFDIVAVMYRDDENQSRINLIKDAFPLDLQYSI